MGESEGDETNSLQNDMLNGNVHFSLLCLWNFVAKIEYHNSNMAKVLTNFFFTLKFRLLLHINLEGCRHDKVVIGIS